MIMPSNECHKTLLTISQHCFRYWLGAVRQQAITWTNVVLDPCRHMASLGHNELNEPLLTTSRFTYALTSLVVYFIAFQDWTWMSDYIPWKPVDLITYPCQNHECLVPSHYLNQCWVIVNWILWNLQINFSEISILIYTFCVKKMHLKMLSAKWQPFCPSLNLSIKGPGQVIHIAGLSLVAMLKLLRFLGSQQIFKLFLNKTIYFVL